MCVGWCAYLDADSAFAKGTQDSVGLLVALVGWLRVGAGGSVLFGVVEVVGVGSAVCGVRAASVGASGVVGPSSSVVPSVSVVVVSGEGLVAGVGGTVGLADH